MNRTELKQTIACAAACLLFSLPASSLGAQITLVQCYEAARNNYPLVRQYGLIDQTEGYNLSNASKGWLPQLAVNARANYQSEVTTMPFDADRMAAVIPGFSIKTMSKDQYQLTAELTQAIWDGGTIASVKNIASSYLLVLVKQTASLQVDGCLRNFIFQDCSKIFRGKFSFD